MQMLDGSADIGDATVILVTSDSSTPIVAADAHSIKSGRVPSVIITTPSQVAAPSNRRSFTGSAHSRYDVLVPDEESDVIP
jgi:2,3-bisphosphoglycerate-independent phosphoglycerate mutase